MRTRTPLSLALSFMLLAVTGGSAVAQGMPTTQPARVSIFVERVKVGMDDDHEINEAGWPAAYGKAGSTSYYLALSSMTGPAEVWYVTPYDSYAAEGTQMKWEDGIAGLGAELSRLWRADAQFLESSEQFEAVARPDLSHGAFPDLALVRFFEITTLRIRLGHEQAFEAAAKVYMENFKRVSPNGSYRMYQVTHGMPGANYVVFSTVNDFAEYDRMMADNNAMFTSMNAKDMAILQKATADDFQNVISNRYRVSPGMSYVAPDTKAKDPAFWNKR